MNKSNESAKDLFGSANGGDGRGLIGSEHDDSTKIIYWEIIYQKIN